VLLLLGLEPKKSSKLLNSVCFVAALGGAEDLDLGAERGAYSRINAKDIIKNM
jgi:hypothetical protein